MSRTWQTLQVHFHSFWTRKSTFSLAFVVRLSIVNGHFVHFLFRQHCGLLENVWQPYQSSALSPDSLVPYQVDAEIKESQIFNVINFSSHHLSSLSVLKYLLEHSTQLDNYSHHRKAELKSSLRLCSFFSCFIPNLAKIAVYFTEKIGKDHQKEAYWPSEADMIALKMLEAKLAEPPFIALPRSQGSQNMVTEAWDKQLDCVLLEKYRNRGDEIVQYWSRCLNNADHANDSTQQAVLDVAWTVTILHLYRIEVSLRSAPTTTSWPGLLTW